MADGTTAFSIALAKGNCDLITEFLKFNRKRDVNLARYILQEPKIGDRLRQLLEKFFDTTNEEPHTELSEEVIGLTKIYPYFNEDAETNWKESNSNMEMARDMKNIITKSNYIRVREIDHFKVHEMSFKEQEGTSLPLVSNREHSSAKNK